MGRAVRIILLFLSLSVSAQQKMSFIQVDTSMYQLYLGEDWKELIATGKQAMDQGINYYYLQIRIAYAHFARGEYRTAARYYKKALEFNSKDAIANEYLYYCYLYSGRANDALLQTKHLTAPQKKAMGISDSLSIVSTGISYTYLTSDAYSIHEAIVSDLTDIEGGFQKTSNNFHLPELYFSHRLGKHIVINHALSYLQKNEFSYAFNNGFFLSPEQIMTQLGYGLSVEIAPAEGWLIRPGFNYLDMNIPLFALTDYGPDAGIDRSVFEYKNITNRVFSLQLIKEFRFFNAGISFANNNFNTLLTNQFGIHSTIYPLANLNLYYSLDFYFQHLRVIDELGNSVARGNFIYHHLLGFKIFNNLWMEISNTLPEHMNLYDISNNISYNNIEKIKSSYAATLIVPLYKPGLKIFSSIGYNSNNSYFFPEADKLNPYNPHTYNSITITGGITWTK